MSAASTNYLHLVPNPKSQYRSLLIKATRTRAQTIYGAGIDLSDLFIILNHWR
jgi:hypothetical protein